MVRLQDLTLCLKKKPGLCFLRDLGESAMLVPIQLVVVLKVDGEVERIIAYQLLL